MGTLRMNAHNPKQADQFTMKLGDTLCQLANAKTAKDIEALITAVEMEQQFNQTTPL